MSKVLVVAASLTVLPQASLVVEVALTTSLQQEAMYWIWGIHPYRRNKSAFWVYSSEPQGGPARRVYWSTPLTLFAWLHARARPSVVQRVHGMHSSMCVCAAWTKRVCMFIHMCAVGDSKVAYSLARNVLST